MLGKIAVVGAGIFGITIACKLAKKYKVDLFEMNKDILMGASGINQFRVHRGYHYPRSIETIMSSKLSEPQFKREYNEAINDLAQHYYSIAKYDTLTSGERYLEILKTVGLEYEIASLNFLNSEEIDLTIKVEESLIDPFKLKTVCYEKISKHKVNLLLNTKATDDILKDYDKVIICTYSQNNSLLNDETSLQRDYQFELCEKIIVGLPEEFKNTSLVLLDGPFMCFDPYGETGDFLIGNVVHAIHSTNVGKLPYVDAKYKDLINNGVCNVPEVTKFKECVESTTKFIPIFNKAIYKGSMFTFRTVLPHKEKTDERPTVVTKVNDKIITVFSGKIVNCVQASEDVEKLIES